MGNLIDLRRVLSAPIAYRALGFLTGQGGRARFVGEHVRVTAGMRVLDIGCGPGDILEYLPRDVDYLGFDLSEEYIASARKRYGGRAQFFCQSVTVADLRQHPPFDIVIASGVLHHLNDEEAIELFRLAHSALHVGGRVVTLDGCFVPGQSTAARALLKMDRGKHVRTEPGYVGLARAVFEQVRSTIRHDLLRLPYTHIILECER